MKLARTLLLATLLVLATACAPSTAPTTETGDEREGTLRVWLFDEPNRAPKEEVVNAAVEKFEAFHEGVTVDVAYIAVETRHERFKGAFNDPASAPDVVEYGNTDLSEYVAANGFADITEEFEAWEERGELTDDLVATASVDGTVYGIPWYLGVRALYYRTDVFEELGLEPPTSIAELTDAATRIHAAKPDMVGIAAGGTYTYGMLPFLWAAGGEIATKDGDTYTAGVDSPEARAGVKAYTDLISPEICPPEQCAELGGNDTVELFASGKAGMGILGNFNREAVEAGAVKDAYAVVPLPGVEPGSVAPAFAGGNNLGVMASTQHRSLAVEFTQLLASPDYQRRMYEAMGNLPTLTGLLEELAAEDDFLTPFTAHMEVGTKFVPVDPAWGRIDAEGILPTMVQQVVTGRAPLEQATADAAAQLNDAFSR